MGTVIKSPPGPVQTNLNTIYPWEQDSFNSLIYLIYKQALSTGFTDSFEEFSETLGELFTTLSQVEIYNGSYEATPLVDIEQILRTAGKLLQEDVIINKIPYYETSNDAGGYTVIIG